MAERGDPAVLRHLVIFLRSQTGLTQARFGKKARVAQSEMSEYELGRQAPSEEALRRMADVAGIGWPLVVYLRQAYRDVLSAAAQSTFQDRPPLDLKVLEPALLAATPYLLELATLEPKRPSPDEESREAEEIWERLEKYDIPSRRELIELSPRSGSWALAVQVCKVSVRSAADKPEEALELADLALSIAERAQGAESWRSRLLGYCWAHVANARRSAGNRPDADEGAARARSLWRQGEDPEGRLPEGALEEALGDRGAVTKPRVTQKTTE